MRIHYLMGQGSTVEAEWSGGEVGRVERPDGLGLILLRVALGKAEGFRGSPFAVDMGEVEVGVESVVATTGEDYPA